MRLARGFTLVELMIAVATVAILAAIAYPSYTSYIVRNNRAAAQSVLLDVSQRQQQFLLDNRSYACTVACANTAATQAAIGVIVPGNVSGVYTLSMSAAAGPPPTFTATATPIAGRANANDGNLTINQAGSKTGTGW